MHETVLKTSVIFLVFAFIHSLFLSRAVKERIAQLIGRSLMEGFYRLFYTILSVLTLIAAAWLIHNIPDYKLIDLPLWLEILCRIMQLIGVTLFLYASKHFSILEFTGLRQAMDYLSKGSQRGNIEGLSSNTLITNGAYAIVRHPMYLAGILIFTFNPDITVKGLTLTILADLYLLFGAWIESRRYVEYFGDQYVKYMKEVPMLIPKIPKSLLKFDRF